MFVTLVVCFHEKYIIYVTRGVFQRLLMVKIDGTCILSFPANPQLTTPRINVCLNKSSSFPNPYSHALDV